MKLYPITAWNWKEKDKYVKKYNNNVSKCFLVIKNKKNSSYLQKRQWERGIEKQTLESLWSFLRKLKVLKTNSIYKKDN